MRKRLRKFRGKGRYFDTRADRMRGCNQLFARKSVCTAKKKFKKAAERKLIPPVLRAVFVPININAIGRISPGRPTAARAAQARRCFFAMIAAEPVAVGAGKVVSIELIFKRYSWSEDGVMTMNSEDPKPRSDRRGTRACSQTRNRTCKAARRRGRFKSETIIIIFLQIGRDSVAGNES